MQVGLVDSKGRSSDISSKSAFFAEFLNSVSVRIEINDNLPFA